MPHHHAGPVGPVDLSGRENRQGHCAGPSKTPDNFEGPPTKTLGHTLRLPSALTSAHPTAPCRAISSGLPASCWLTLTLGRSRGALPQGPGTTMLGIGDPQATAPDSPCHRVRTQAYRVATAHLGWENCQGPLRPRCSSKDPRTKTLEPSSPSPGPHLCLPSAHLTGSDWACQPPGG